MALVREGSTQWCLLDAQQDEGYGNDPCDCFRNRTLEVIDWTSRLLDQRTVKWLLNQKKTAHMAACSRFFEGGFFIVGVCLIH